MKFSPRQLAILRGILSDIEKFAALSPRYGSWAATVERERIEDAQNGVAKSAPAAWLGRKLTASDHVLLSRDYTRLENLGLIERLALGGDGAKTTHFALTDAGRAAAADGRDMVDRDGPGRACERAA